MMDYTYDDEGLSFGGLDQSSVRYNASMGLSQLSSSHLSSYYSSDDDGDLESPVPARTRVELVETSSASSASSSDDDSTDLPPPPPPPPLRLPSIAEGGHSGSGSGSRSKRNMMLQFADGTDAEQRHQQQQQQQRHHHHHRSAARLLQARAQAKALMIGGGGAEECAPEAEKAAVPSPPTRAAPQDSSAASHFTERAIYGEKDAAVSARLGKPNGSRGGKGGKSSSSGKGGLFRRALPGRIRKMARHDNSGNNTSNTSTSNININNKSSASALNISSPPPPIESAMTKSQASSMPVGNVRTPEHGMLLSPETVATAPSTGRGRNHPSSSSSIFSPTGSSRPSPHHPTLCRSGFSSENSSLDGLSTTDVEVDVKTMEEQVEEISPKKYEWTSPMLPSHQDLMAVFDMDADANRSLDGDGEVPPPPPPPPAQAATRSTSSARADTADIHTRTVTASPNLNLNASCNSHANVCNSVNATQSVTEGEGNNSSRDESPIKATRLETIWRRQSSTATDDDMVVSTTSASSSAATSSRSSRSSSRSNTIRDYDRNSSSSTTSSSPPAIAAALPLHASGSDALNTSIESTEEGAEAAQSFLRNIMSVHGEGEVEVSVSRTRATASAASADAAAGSSSLNVSLDSCDSHGTERANAAAAAAAAATAREAFERRSRWGQSVRSAGIKWGGPSGRVLVRERASTRRSKASTEEPGRSSGRTAAAVTRVSPRMRPASAVKIQAIYRGYKARQAWYRLVCQQVVRAGAATVIARNWRRCANRRRFLDAVTAATIVQACSRGTLARTRFANAVKATVLLQSIARGSIQRRALVEQQQAATSIQSIARGSSQRKALMEQQEAATAIQTIARGNSTRKMTTSQRSAATSIQRSYRTFFTSRTYQSQRAFSIVIQSAYRSSKERVSFQAAVNAATALQAMTRGHQLRKVLDDQSEAASVIQRNWREYSAAENSNADRSDQKCNVTYTAAAVVAVQAFVHGSKERKANIRANEAARSIQRCFASYQDGFLPNSTATIAQCVDLLPKDELEVPLDGTSSTSTSMADEKDFLPNVNLAVPVTAVILCNESEEDAMEVTAGAESEVCGAASACPGNEEQNDIPEPVPATSTSSSDSSEVDDAFLNESTGMSSDSSIDTDVVLSDDIELGVQQALPSAPDYEDYRAPLPSAKEVWNETEGAQASVATVPPFQSHPSMRVTFSKSQLQSKSSNGDSSMKSTSEPVTTVIDIECGSSKKELSEATDSDSESETAESNRPSLDIPHGDVEEDNSSNTKKAPASRSRSLKLPSCKPSCDCWNINFPMGVVIVLAIFLAIGLYYIYALAVKTD